MSEGLAQGPSYKVTLSQENEDRTHVLCTKRRPLYPIGYRLNTNIKIVLTEIEQKKATQRLLYAEKKCGGLSGRCPKKKCGRKVVRETSIGGGAIVGYLPQDQEQAAYLLKVMKQRME